MSFYVRLSLLAMLVSSCISSGGMSPSGSARGYVVDFLVEGGGMQYFVKPIPLEDDEQGVEMNLDITFRIGAAQSDSTTMNFTLIGVKAPVRVDSACVGAAGSCQSLDRLRTMFIERHDDDVHARYTSSLGQQKLFMLMKDPVWTLRVWGGGQEFTFAISSRARKAIATTYTSVIEPTLDVPTAP
jgi:hypothetical protein